MPLIVNEIFQSIQGESLYSGLSCIFIRLTGCNLRCHYCDTEYAWSEGSQLDIIEIINQVKAFNGSLVELTGGEPLLQCDTPVLVKQLIEEGYNVLIETNGSIDIGILAKECIKIVDIKCPSSNESGKNNYENIKKLSPGDQLKFVISDSVDYNFAKDIIRKFNPPVKTGNILFSPITSNLNPAELSEWIVKDGLGVRLQLQMHKIIWPDIERGV